MNFFYVLNMKSVKQVSFIIILAFFTAWGIFISNYVYTPVLSTQDGPKALYKGEKDVALTFNIGWGDEKAEQILDVLEEEEVKAATFFLAGSWAERNPDLVKRIVELDFEIGILGYDYKDYTKLEVKEIKSDINKAITAFDKLNVKNIKFMRAPTGSFNKETLTIAEHYRLTVVHWSVDSKDWTNPGLEEIVKNVQKAKKGDILLLHASDGAKQTAAALPEVINHFKKKNLSFVTITEMIASADVKSKEIK